MSVSKKTRQVWYALNPNAGCFFCGDGMRWRTLTAKNRLGEERWCCGPCQRKNLGLFHPQEDFQMLVNEQGG
jgi:hypothetical protein